MKTEAVVVENTLGTYRTREKVQLSHLVQIQDAYLDRQLLSTVDVLLQLPCGFGASKGSSVAEALFLPVFGSSISLQ